MQTWPWPTLADTHQYYVRTFDEARAQLHDLETDLQALATD